MDKLIRILDSRAMKHAKRSLQGVFGRVLLDEQ